MPDYFHEAYRALEGARHEFTATSSVNATGIYAVPHACELALRGLYTTAMGKPFPQNSYKPHHQPESLARQLGVTSYYPPALQSFLSELTGRALSDARYPGSTPHEQYTKSTSGQTSFYLIEQAEAFVRESQAMSGSAAVIAAIQAKAIA